MFDSSSEQNYIDIEFYVAPEYMKFMEPPKNILRSGKRNGKFIVECIKINMTFKEDLKVFFAILTSIAKVSLKSSFKNASKFHRISGGIVIGYAKPSKIFFLRIKYP